MAITRIWDVKCPIGDLIRYAENEEKTRVPDFSGLDNALGYAQNPTKTVRDQQLFVSGINCTPAICREQMQMTKQRFGKQDGTAAFHAVQSFSPGEVTPEQCHAIGVEFARKCWGDRFEVIVATHLNTDCCHNHFVVNSVSFADGKRYNDCKKSYRRIRALSDEICRDHGLSVIESPASHRTPRNIYLAEKNGEPTRYNVMRRDIDLAIGRCWSLRDLPAVLGRMGYVVSFDPKRKYATIRRKEDEHATRFKTLGEQYTEDALKTRIAEHKRVELPDLSPQHRAQRKQALSSILKMSGFIRLYYYYCYLLGAFPKVPHYLPLHPALREDMRRLDTTIAQLRLLEKYDLLNESALSAFRDLTEAEMTVLSQQRTKQENILRRHRDDPEADAAREQRTALTEAIAEKRKTLKLVKAIPGRVQAMEHNIALYEQHVARQEQRRNENAR